MCKSPSDAEQKLWQSLRRKQLDGLKFRRQLPIGPFIADFACNESKLIVEVDGAQHDAVAGYDDRRTKYLEALGWRVIRFSAWDTVKEHDGVLDTILREARRPPP